MKIPQDASDSEDNMEMMFDALFNSLNTPLRPYVAMDMLSTNRILGNDREVIQLSSTSN